MRKQKRYHRTFVCEQLEIRCLLAGFQSIDESAFHAVIVAGDPNGSPADSPTARVDPNTPTSPFSGVGSLQITANRGTYICTGTPIDAFHVVTAAHCVDLNSDGVSNKKDGITKITFNLNLDTDTGTDSVDVRITATSWRTHPDYTGFNRPSVNDDMAVITLGNGGVPASVPTYSLVSTDMVAQATDVYMVGYGRSGDGVSGYSTNASFTVKRVGENIVDAFYGQDDAVRVAANEVFRFDFDGPAGSGILGGPTLGNDRETTLGGGDSGGPSFVLLPNGNPSLSSSYQFAGVNTFTQGATAPKFGSLGGGMNVFPYKDWILYGTAPTGGTSGGNGNRGSGAGLSLDDKPGADESLALLLPPTDVFSILIAPATTLPASFSPSISPRRDTLVSSDASTPAALAQTFSLDSLEIAPSDPTFAVPDRENLISRDDRLNFLDEIFNLETLDELFV